MSSLKSISLSRCVDLLRNLLNGWFVGTRRSCRKQKTTSDTESTMDTIKYLPETTLKRKIYILTTPKDTEGEQAVRRQTCQEKSHTAHRPNWPKNRNGSAHFLDLQPVQMDWTGSRYLEVYAIVLPNHLSSSNVGRCRPYSGDMFKSESNRRTGACCRHFLLYFARAQEVTLSCSAADNQQGCLGIVLFPWMLICTSV